MSALSRRKGASYERRIANQLTEATGTRWRRLVRNHEGDSDVVADDPAFERISVECKHATTLRLPVAKKAVKRAPKAPSPLEERFARDLQAMKVLEPTREHRFAPPRRWRFDFAWPAFMLAVEIEGGVWTNGRHTRGSGFIADISKYNAATLAGWKVLRFTEKSVRDGSAAELVARLLRVPPYNPGIV